jgi:hypothetical protein
VAWEPDAPVWIELHGQAGFPLVRHQFTFTLPSADVLTIPAVFATAGAALGVRF